MRFFSKKPGEILRLSVICHDGVGMWGCWAGAARPTPPHLTITTGIPKDPKSRGLIFATDLHGSERTFGKILNAGKFFNANVLIMGEISPASCSFRLPTNPMATRHFSK